MSRGVYSHEQDDSDFAWLINNYKNSGKKCILIDIPGAQIVLVTLPDAESEAEHVNSSQQTLERSNQERQ